ncbi:MAG: hypothetical protein ACLS82_12400 [Evtepia gabavorous]
MEYCLLHGLGQSPADWAAVEAGLPGQKILCPDLAAWWADRPVTYESLLEGLEAQCAGREEAMVLCGAPWGPFSPWTMPGVIPDRCRPWC